MTQSIRNLLVLSFLLAVNVAGFAGEASTNRADSSSTSAERIDRNSRVIKSTYPVHGETVREVIDNANKNNPNKTGNPGETEWDYLPTITQVDTSCRLIGPSSYRATAAIIDVEISATITVTLPTWVEADKASPSNRKVWLEVRAELEKHEEEHVSDFLEGAHEVKRAILSTTGAGTGSTLAEALTNAIRNAYEEAGENATRAARQVHERSQRRDLYLASEESGK